jgi:hypothetical protein
MAAPTSRGSLSSGIPTASAEFSTSGNGSESTSSAHLDTDAINANFDFGWIPKMGLLQVLGADVEGREFGVGRCCAKSALFHVFNLII